MSIIGRPVILHFAIFKLTTYFIFGLLLLFLTSGAQATQKEDADMNFRLDKLVEKPTVRSDSNSTADHSKFEELKAPFMSGPEVTKACLKCHTEAGHQFMKNIHWTWNYENKKTGQLLGKKHLVNTFCTNSRGNEGMCAQCHAGYGWKDETFDFNMDHDLDIKPIAKSQQHFQNWVDAYPFYANVEKEGVKLFEAA